MGLGGRAPATSVWQLAGTWIAGSVTTGTLVVLLTSGQSRWPESGPPFRPLGEVAPPVLVGVIGTVAVLFAGLAVLAVRTAAASWLPDHWRGTVLWLLLVGGLGLLGWGFAATVTVGAGFAPDVRIPLAYAGGGLPFALVAVLLHRRPGATLFGGVAAVALLVTGYLLVDGANTLGLNAIQLYAYFMAILIGP